MAGLAPGGSDGHLTDLKDEVTQLQSTFQQVRRNERYSVKWFSFGCICLNLEMTLAVVPKQETVQSVNQSLAHEHKCNSCSVAGAHVLY